VGDAGVVEVMHQAVHQDEVELRGARDVRCHTRDSKLSAVALCCVRHIALVEVITEILRYLAERASVGAWSTTDVENERARRNESEPTTGAIFWATNGACQSKYTAGMSSMSLTLMS
jgi:hypothetical protein